MGEGISESRDQYNSESWEGFIKKVKTGVLPMFNVVRQNVLIDQFYIHSSCFIVWQPSSLPVMLVMIYSLEV